MSELQTKLLEKRELSILERKKHTHKIVMTTFYKIFLSENNINI